MLWVDKQTHEHNAHMALLKAGIQKKLLNKNPYKLQHVMMYTLRYYGPVIYPGMPSQNSNGMFT